MPGKLNIRSVARALAALLCGLCALRPAAPAAPPDDGALSAAVCSIVYPMDQTPSARGYRYLFYGNGFFINEQGYIATAAHVLSQIRSGQPYILLTPPSGPSRIMRAMLTAVDPDHDVAVLRAIPNPFDGGYKVGFLPLAPAWLAPGRTVLAASRHPIDSLHAYTTDAFVDDRSPGQIFDFQFSQLYRGLGQTELYLFTPQVRRGQSGAPLISPESQQVVGIVEGQWLRSTVVQLATADDGDLPGVGAAVPVHYLIALLQQKGIAWHAASPVSQPAASAGVAGGTFSPPTPVSLVASPFPSQALFGGEVILDALIDAKGRVSDTTIVRGDSPFLESVVAAVRTWSFSPAQLEGQPIAARVGITFRFAQSYEPLRAPPVEQHHEPMPGSLDRGAFPIVTVEPRFPPTAVRDGNAILSATVDSQGRLGPLEVLLDTELLAPASVSVIEKWRFSPARRANADSDSLAIVVVVFRFSGAARPVSASPP